MVKKPEIIEIFSRFRENKPSPKIELNYINPYTLLVAVILSAQSTDKGVNKVTDKLFSIVTNPSEMLDLGEDGLKDMIKTIGLYNSKASNIIRMSQILIDKFESQVPDNYDDLCSLPGVGSKSANVMLNSIFGHPTIAVDTHVFRVSNRIGLCKTKTPIETEKKLPSVIPDEFKHLAHHWLVLHGRYVCVARSPKCAQCIIRDICKFKNKNSS
jgi:endonuclease-3